MSLKIAFVFPGQGSQVLGMLASLANHSPLIQERFKLASEVLGFDLWALSQTGPIEMLNQTALTQPVLLTAGVAIWDLWQSEKGMIPYYFAGHSLGEYTALTCAGSFDFIEAVTLVANRGLYMQEAVPKGEGAMAAILGLSDSQVSKICEQATSVGSVSPANYNTPGQIVISGHSASVDRAIALAKEQGAKLAKRIPVSVPAHCQLMKPAAQRLANDLGVLTCKIPKIPVVNNVSASIETSTQAIQHALIKQLYSPVLWVDTIQWLLQQGVNAFIECGPGRVLSGLIKRISPADTYMTSIGEWPDFKKALGMGAELIF